MVQKPESDIEPKRRRIDLSVPQVAGSAVAAVAAAVAASQLGVYGTILGAGVMSVVATCGGSVFQHFFRRTGEQIREVTVQVKHPGREVTVHTRETIGGRDAEAVPRENDATTVLRTVPEDPDRTRPLGQLDRTRPLATVGAGPDEEFTEATTHGTRIRGWKRPALGAVVVFAVTMAGITTFELVSGSGLSGGEGTTVGSVVRGGTGGSGAADPTPTTSTDPGTGQTSGQQSPATPGTDSQGGQSQSPDSGRSDASSADPTPTPSGSTGGGTSPSPAATPSPAVPGSGGTADPNPTGAGDATVQGDRATTGTDTGQ
ncbi:MULTISPECIES: hypothetical protein [unclassified Streptomyces]|uniref:hypothetical protein n=1 Tax=unclassified Streptomyces TaxID=2593676 RepID=UPI0036E7BEB3